VPELPDILLYLHALEPRIVCQPLERVRLASPFLLRSVEPPITAAEGRTVRSLRRLGKRIVIGLEGDLYLVLHLMIAGRLRWRERGAAIPGKVGLAAFDFPGGTAILTEAGSRRQASLHVVSGQSGLAAHDRWPQSAEDWLAAAFRKIRAGDSSPYHLALLVLW
jgi:formamidopyrimidine-DNA glycosylase